MKPFGRHDVATGEAIRERGYRIENIYDVGASTSVWTRTMRGVFPDARFDMFEPLAQHNAEYGERLQNFLASDSHAKLHEVAVGSEDGEVTMIMTPRPVGSTIIPLQKTAKGTRLTVPVRSVDSLVASGEAPVPDLIKADIQGGELGLLQGARTTLPKVKFLLMETWLTRGYGLNTPLLVELMRYLAEFGFFPYEMANVFRSVKDYAAAIDVWFINRNFANTPAEFYLGESERDARPKTTGIVHCSRSVEDDGSSGPEFTDRSILRSVREREYEVKCVFDIGASNAAWSFAMADELGPDARFELFEPLAELNSAYHEELARFERLHPGSAIHAAAVADSNGTTALFETRDGSGSTTLPVNADLRPGKTVNVPASSIDSLVASGRVPNPDLMRFAVQGGEMAGLRGASKTLAQTTLLVIQTWFVRAYGAQTPVFSEIADYLFDFGFVPFEFGDVWRDETDLLIKANVWFLNVAKSKAPPWYYTNIP